jgi:hypothetical protein
MAFVYRAGSNPPIKQSGDGYLVGVQFSLLVASL